MKGCTGFGASSTAIGLAARADTGGVADDVAAGPDAAGGTAMLRGAADVGGIGELCAFEGDPGLGAAVAASSIALSGTAVSAG